jgi:DNA transformation protein and related proteins
VTPDDIVELFSGFGPVSVRRMFGGAGIYADGRMFALVADGVIYLKAGASNVAMFEREELPPFTYARGTGQGIVMSYRRMPDRLYDDPDELVTWARAACAVANEARRSRRIGAQMPTPTKAAAKKTSSKKAKSKKTKSKKAKSSKAGTLQREKAKRR